MYDTFPIRCNIIFFAYFFFFGHKKPWNNLNVYGQVVKDKSLMFYWSFKKWLGKFAFIIERDQINMSQGERSSPFFFFFFF